MEEATGTVTSKVNKISEMLSELTDRATPASPWSDDKENSTANDGVRHEILSIASSRPPHHSNEAFYGRVSTFGVGLWGARKISPLECARWGWRLVERDMLQCVTCRQVLSAALPSQIHTEAYSNFVGILRDNLVKRHCDECWWRHHPSPLELTLPPRITSSDHLHNLTNAAHSLLPLGPTMPYINIQILMDKLCVSEDLVRSIFPGIDDGLGDVRKKAVLLVLCGWSRGQGSNLRCQVCRRTIGLWSLYNQVDHLLQKEEESITPAKRKGSGELDEESAEKEEGSPLKKLRGKDETGDNNFATSNKSDGKTREGENIPKRSPRAEGRSQSLSDSAEKKSPMKSPKDEGRSRSLSDGVGEKSPKKSHRAEEEKGSSKKAEERWNMQLRGRHVSGQSTEDSSRLRGRLGSEQSSDDGSCSVSSRLRGRLGSEQSSDDGMVSSIRQDIITETPRSRRRNRRAELTKEHLVTQSPLIIGSSPSTQIQKIEEKRFFEPLEEHRYWCTWVMEMSGHSTKTDGGQTQANTMDTVPAITETMDAGPTETDTMGADSTDGDRIYANPAASVKGYTVVIQSVKEMVTLTGRKNLSSSDKYGGNVEGLRTIRSLLGKLTSDLL